MRSPVVVIALMWLMALPPVAASAQARRSRQQRNLPWRSSHAGRDRDSSIKSPLGLRISRGRYDAFGSTATSRLSTRPERLRAELHRRFSRRRGLRERGLLSLEPPSASPITRLLDRRNLLMSRSNLGRSDSVFIDRSDYLRDASGKWRGRISSIDATKAVQAVPRGSATQAASYPTMLSERLKKKADEYYTLGGAYFREKQYARSQDYFGLVRQLEPERPRAFAAGVIVAYQRLEFNSAVMSLIHAIKKAETLDDLKIDWKGLYTSRQEFGKVVESVNLMAKSSSNSQAANLLLAYYAWLNGDANTAIAAARAAELSGPTASAASAGAEIGLDRRGNDSLSEAAKRFHELLTKAKARGQAEGAEAGLK